MACERGVPPRTERTLIQIQTLPETKNPIIPPAPANAIFLASSSHPPSCPALHRLKSDPASHNTAPAKAPSPAAAVCRAHPPGPHRIHSHRFLSHVGPIQLLRLESVLLACLLSIHRQGRAKPAWTVRLQEDRPRWKRSS